jgi:hypothetical protein
MRYRAALGTERSPVNAVRAFPVFGPRDVSRLLILVTRVSRDPRLTSQDPGATAGQGAVSGGTVNQISLVSVLVLSCMSGHTRDTLCLLWCCGVAVLVGKIQSRWSLNSCKIDNLS